MGEIKIGIRKKLRDKGEGIEVSKKEIIVGKIKE